MSSSVWQEVCDLLESVPKALAECPNDESTDEVKEIVEQAKCAQKLVVKVELEQSSESQKTFVQEFLEEVEQEIRNSLEDRLRDHSEDLVSKILQACPQICAKHSPNYEAVQSICGTHTKVSRDDIDELGVMTLEKTLEKKMTQLTTDMTASFANKIGEIFVETLTEVKRDLNAKSQAASKRKSTDGIPLKTSQKENVVTSAVEQSPSEEHTEDDSQSTPVPKARRQLTSDQPDVKGSPDSEDWVLVTSSGGQPSPTRHSPANELEVDVEHKEPPASPTKPPPKSPCSPPLSPTSPPPVQPTSPTMHRGKGPAPRPPSTDKSLGEKTDGKESTAEISGAQKNENDEAGLPELPPMRSSPLNHPGKARPRRPKSHAPSVPVLKIGMEQNFRSSLASPLNSDPEITDTTSPKQKKKKRFDIFKKGSRHSSSTDEPLSPKPLDDKAKSCAMPAGMAPEQPAPSVAPRLVRMGVGMPGLGGAGGNSMMEELRARQNRRQDGDSKPAGESAGKRSSDPPRQQVPPPRPQMPAPSATLPLLRPVMRQHETKPADASSDKLAMDKRMTVKDRAALLATAGGAPPPPVAAKPRIGRKPTPDSPNIDETKPTSPDAAAPES